MRFMFAALLAAAPLAVWAQSAPNLVQLPSGQPTHQISAADLMGYFAGKLDTPTSPLSVFIGSASTDFGVLANPGAVAPLLATGTIGLYQHANGSAAVGVATMATMRNVWKLPASGGETLTEISDEKPDAGYLAFFGGAYASLSAMNLTDAGRGVGTGTYTASSTEAHPGQQYPGYMTAADLAGAQQAIRDAVAAGARVVVVFETPNGGNEDLDDPFATSGYWANVRALALYGGGIGIDAPPSYWKARGAQYQAFIKQIAMWARSNHLPLLDVVSPFATTPDASGNLGGCGFDPNFLLNTVAYASDLAASGASPTEWVVESYCGTSDSANTTNKITLLGGPGTINEVALYLAQSAVVSPLGTTPAAVSGVAEASLRTMRPRRMFAKDLAGLGGMAFQSPSSVYVTGGAMDNVIIGHGGRSPEIDTVNLDVSGGVAFRGPVAFTGGWTGMAANGASTMMFDATSGLGRFQNLSAVGSLGIPFASVPSSSSTCPAGNIQVDAGYIYVCTAANTWKRAALAGF